MRVALKARIFASGNSQRQVSALCNISENRLSEIVRGWASPTAREQDALMRVLRCGVDVFGAEESSTSLSA